MSDLDSLKKIEELKNVSRILFVGNRKESSAEHTWVTLVLADYFYKKEKLDIDLERAKQLLLYHDLVEIEVGDVAFHDELARESKKELETQAAKNLALKIPVELKEIFESAFLEYEENKSPESCFAHAIDKLEPVLHISTFKDDLQKLHVTEKILREKKEPYLKEYPHMLQLFEETLAEFKKEGNLKED